MSPFHEQWIPLVGESNLALLDGVHLPEPKCRLGYITAKNRRRMFWDREKFASVETKAGRIYSNTHSQHELSEMSNGWGRRISHDAWDLTNIGTYTFTSVRHPLYHRPYEEKQCLFDTLDRLLKLSQYKKKKKKDSPV